MMKALKLTAIATLLAAVAVPSLFADSRHRDRTDDRYGRRSQSRYATVEGRIRDIDRDRNGFVIRLDRGEVLFAAAQTRVDNVSDRRGRNRTHVRQLERGDYIRATGQTEARGSLFVDRIALLREEDDRGGRDDSFITGTVDSVDRRGNVVYVQDRRSGRVITVDLRRADGRDHRYDADDLRRGDRVTIRGDWRRDGRFEAERVEVDRGSSRW